MPTSLHVTRTTTILDPDQSRVLLRPFVPGGPERVAGIVARIMALPEEEVGRLLDQVSAEFSSATGTSASSSWSASSRSASL